jgi:8-amino-3,8-dideoxy-alpha-D-manno-octulosonate transaminase
MGRDELEMVARVIMAKSPFRYYGPNLQHMVDSLESAFCERLGRKYALAVGSGSAALYLASGALGIGPGDEVLLPGYLWVSCLSAIVRLGAIPRLVDIDDTFCMSPADFAAKIGPRTKAALFVHMSGAPGDLDALTAIARDAGLKVVEDCAQANGASYHGKPVGTFSDIAIFSLQLNKNMSAGEGGVLVCDDEDLYKRAFALHDMGYARNSEGRLEVGDERYQFWGIGSRMSELTGAVACAQLDKLDSVVNAMRTAKWKIKKALADIPRLKFRRVVDPEGDSGPFLITLLDSAEMCTQFVDALRAEGIKGPEGSMACVTMEEWGFHWHFNNLSLVHRRGVTPTGWPWNDPANAFAKEYKYSRGMLANCDDFAMRSILLTIASCLTDKDIDDIIRAYKKVADALL